MTNYRNSYKNWFFIFAVATSMLAGLQRIITLHSFDYAENTDHSILNVSKSGTIVASFQMSPISLELIPTLRQTFWIEGEEAGVSSSLYYITASDVEKARATWTPKNGCWTNQFNSVHQELLTIDDDKNIIGSVAADLKNYDRPMPRYEIQGYLLDPIEKGNIDGSLHQIARSRHGQFVKPVSVKRMPDF